MPQATIGGRALRLGWNRGPSDSTTTVGVGEIAAARTDSGSCRFGNLTFGKSPLGKIHLGKNPLGKYLKSDL